MRHRVPLFTALSCILLTAACREPSQRVFIRTGEETSLVDHGDVASVSLPITLESRFSGNVVTTGVGLEILAQVDAPVVDGITLQATDAQWVGDRVYAAYNVRGDSFSGAIQIIDVSTPEAPVVLAEAIYPNTDIARIVVCGNTILAAGADEDEGATLEWFTLQGEELSVGGYQALGSHSATYVSVDGNRAYVSFGDSQGGAAVFDIGGDEPALLRSVERFDARWVGEADDHDLLLLSGSPGLLERFEGGADGESADMQDVSVPGAGVGAPTWAERANDLLYVSADQEGMIVFDLRGLEVAGVLDTDGDANGLVLAADRRLAFLANGDAGLAVVDVSDAGHPELLASIDVSDDSGSANAVAASGEHLALADGLGGVKIIHYAREQDVEPGDCDDDGVPDEQDGDDDDDGVLDEDDGSDCNPDLVCGEGEVHVVGSFFGNFYDLPCDHPDVEGPITGVCEARAPTSSTGSIANISRSAWSARRSSSTTPRTTSRWTRACAATRTTSPRTGRPRPSRPKTAPTASSSAATTTAG